MALNEYEIKKMMCDVGKRIYDRNMVAANDGNISVKLNDNEFLCTPTGVSKGFMTPEYICKVDAQGNVIQANKGFKPSSEIKMHMRVYAKRPDVGAVVHAHPTFATSFAIAGIPLTQPIMPEAVIAFCKGIQAGSPVDSHVAPEPYAMPGYHSDVIMAAGAFIQGSSIELSADGPIEPPFAVYFQGGLTWYHARFGITMSLQYMKNEGLISQL